MLSCGDLSTNHKLAITTRDQLSTNHKLAITSPDQILAQVFDCSGRWMCNTDSHDVLLSLTMNTDVQCVVYSV